MALLGDGPHQVLKIKTTLGKDKLLVLRMSGREHLGSMSEYVVEMVGNVDMLGKAEDVDFKKLLGTRANVTMEVPGDDDPRQFNGFIVKMHRGERYGRYEGFTAFIRPWLWFLTLNRNSRVFQAKSVKDIVTEVLGDYSSGTDHAFRLAGTYPKLEYCIQYQESDFDFVSRLLEEAGIYYFFEHTDTKHTMVMVDDMAKHKPKPVEKKIKWANSLQGDSTVMNWLGEQELRAVKATVKEYDYLASATKIESTEAAKKPLSNKMGTMEVYEYPADVVQDQVKAESQPATDDAKQKALVTMERLVSMQAAASGTTNARDVSVGTIFEMEESGGGLLGSLFGGGTDKQRAGKYLVVGARYTLEFADHEAISDLKAVQRKRDGFVCDLIAISSEGSNFRPERSTRRPGIGGPQTATVVGASGNEIETDKHGRVKVQFHWDRLGKKDVNSSCYVRVMQPSAGKAFGFWSVPRVGQEVVVSFIEGNPDRPLIIGSVYNDQNTIAYELPKLATVSGWRTHSSKEGAADMFNELRFEDEKTKEYVWFQAQRDFYRSVKENAFDMVLKNESVKVKLTRKEVIGENWYMNVGKDVMHEFGKDLHVKVAADVFLTGGATYQVQIAKDISVKGGADAGIDITGKTELKAGGDINLKGGGNFNLKAATNIVQQAGAKLSLKAGADLLAEGVNVKIKGSAEVVIEGSAGIKLVCGGSSIALSAAGVDIVGAMVKINSGGGGGSAGSADAAADAAPKAPTEAKNQEDLTSGKATDYDKLFEDPIIKAGGAGGGAA